ncbi:MAG: hypothetical protein ACI4R8_03255 [Candidatus Caccovivens sp.]
MKNKNYFKNFIYIFFALCLFAVGSVFVDHKPETVSAENTESVEINNQNIPQYFWAKEYLTNGSSSEENSSSLISADTFLYYQESDTSTELHLSLATNGNIVNKNSASDIYSFCYYPDENDTSYFNFYSVRSVSLYINGEYQSLNMGNFAKPSGLTFTNYDSAQPDSFEMVFSKNETQGNNINILNSSGQVIEGVYTLSLELTLYTCNDGKADASEDSTSFSDTNPPAINYSFYVLSRDNYFDANRPKVQNGNFDHIVPITGARNPNYAYYLYSNYSSKGTNESDAYKTPYIEYDYTRFELEVSKEISDVTTSSKLVYDIDSESVVDDGANLVEFKLSDNKCRVYFINVGDYTLSFSPIKLVNYSDGMKKYSLDGVANITKKMMAYMYGYQANYTDMDKPLDENNIRQTSEFKAFDKENEVFVNGADITSGFLNSKENYSQSASNTTFLIGNILNYINNAGEKGKVLTPAKTNQTPIKFSANANLYQSQNAYSYIYSTTKISSAYSETSAELNGQKLYRTAYAGRTESTAGTYIYIIPYTFDNYYDTETSNRSDLIFFQVFYFEITKELPSISIKTESNKTVYSQTYVNENVNIEDDTAQEIYNKDVTVRIYAQEFGNNGYLEGFGGANGITLDSLSGNALSANAHYTVRLYFTNEMTDSNIVLSSKSGYFREQSFTIDKTPINNITGTNVTELTNSTAYKVGNVMENFATNQSIVLSWDNKASGAQTYAYYRYFPLVQAQYYSKQDSTLSTTINRMINNTSAFLPVNYVLNMSTDNNNWLSYYGNTDTSKEEVSAEYVLSDSGFYLVDVYDEAGNHSVEVFLIDNSTPLFAINDGSKYSLTSPSMYITSASTLYWANYKAIYIANWKTVAYNSSYNANNITESVLKEYEFYKTYSGDTSVDIFKIIYSKLKQNNYLQSISCNVSIDRENDGISSLISSYSGNYLTIPINSVSYYTQGTNGYVQQQNVYSQVISALNELTYRVLIRDLSNTKLDPIFATDPNAIVHYTNYYSARQTIIVSFDSSEFAIKYENKQGILSDLSENINNSVVDTVTIGETVHNTKTTYLAPTKMEKAFTLSFLPTTSDGELLIQVESVIIKYYPYIQKSETKDFVDALGNTQTITYFYMELSESATEIVVYSYNDETDAQTSVKQEPIKLNSEGFTTSGKYEIKRTYLVDGSHSYNQNDYYERTFVLYVDRNEVITNAERVTDSNGNSHTESLVGGDVFVAMYDNKQNANLVVTFPNSPDGNTNGASLYNNGNVKSILTTNMLPVYVYVPQTKYTINAQKNETIDGYNFEVISNDKMNNYSENNNILEYYLYAEVFKDGRDVRNLIAKSSSDYSNLAQTNGFLTFYKNDGQPLEYLSEAGLYYVNIYQGRFGLEVDENRYEQCMTFCFKIERSNPDFIIQSTTGMTLNSKSSTFTTYYTNQTSVNLLWNAGSTYMAEIDIDSITLKTSNRATPYSINDDVLDKPITLSNGVYIAQLNLEKLGIYQNDAYVDITMQYKNHNDDFYQKITKRLFVDLSAPSTNVQSLVEKSTASGLIAPLTNNALRTYYTAQMNPTADLNNTSYNVSGTNLFAYYSYSVTNDFENILKSSDSYRIYTRAFVDSDGNNTKYKAGFEQETSPADFLSSNFIEINSADFKGFEKNKYYEIIETDMAGNMSIYTIYIVDYSNADIITYIDANGLTHSYGEEDYQLANSYPNAIHNIYSRTGFVLQDINYFGDAWAQIRLENVNVNGFSNTMYLMLSPWKQGYAYAFVGSNMTEIAIPELLNGLISSRYKSALHIFNREKGNADSFDDFYINIRNTDFTATLTDNKTREYIKFTMPSDQSIRDKTFASTYATSLKIWANGDLLYEQTNKLGFASLWQGSDKIIVSTDSTTGTITFEINPTLNLDADTRIVYEFTDNYGQSYKEIHLYKENIITQEISSINDLYAYYNSTTGKLFYITKDGFKFAYNPNKYVVHAYDFIGEEKSDTLTNANFVDDKGVITFTTNRTEEFYNDSFVLEIVDFVDNTNLVKTIYFTLYNQLPKANYPQNEGDKDRNNQPGEFKLLDASRNNITQTIMSGSNESGYFSEVTVMYSTQETFIPIKYSISRNGIDWEEIASGTRLRCTSNEMEKYYLKIWYDESYLKNETGFSTYVFEKVPKSQIFEFNLSSLTSTFWIEKTVNGITEIVTKSNTIYTSPSGTQSANHYIVNLDYNDRDSIEIKTNKEQNIVYTLIEEQVQSIYSKDVYSDIYLISNGTNFKANVVITYIPTSNNFVDGFYTYNTNGIIDKSENLINLTSKSFVISETYASLDRIELQWSKYYGIPQNEINISLVKDGVELSPIIYTKKDGDKTYNYLYLTYSGKYTIKLFDNAGNIQKFNYGNAGQTESFNFVFLKDVPFTVTYTNVETEQEETSLPIKQAVYNGNVTINIDKNSRSEFYASNGYPIISVKKNGQELSEEQIKELTVEQTSTTKYNFTESGYYEIYFTATSNIPEIGVIRQEIYQFTILNANEYRYAYVYNRYSNYYIETVKKNDKDITESLLQTLDVSTISVNKKIYLAELPLSYLDEKTGAGTYLITINSNNTTLNSSSIPTKLTFKVIIQVGSAPIKVSLPEGEKTTGSVTITFNSANIYQEMGECTFRIVKYSDTGVKTFAKYSIDSASSNEITETLSSSDIGTYYIQIVSPSGNLLYSYKVLKQEPMNPASIIAIVISVVLVVVIVLIVIKLRKRISVK